MKKLYFALILFCALATFAQELAPSLMIKENGTSEPLRVSKVKVESVINGFVTETKMTMTFSNPKNRILEGELYFPLPQGSTVAGYALDINGKMIDGVIVEKAKGRQVFEKIVRQKVDPGLVEWTKGNNFKTRVYPIPANGTRTVMVRYVSEINKSTYQLPLNFKEKLDEFHIKVEVRQPAEAPTIRKSGISNFAFKNWNQNYVAEQTLKGLSLTKDLIIDLPKVEEKAVSIEKANDSYYFTINTKVKALKTTETTNFNNLTIFWDASNSRAKVDHEPEFELLRQFFKTLPRLKVNLVVFRNEVDEAKTFDNAEKLISFLKEIPYDGATQLGVLPQPENADICVLFSDGLSNFGKDKLKLSTPVYTFSGSSSTNHAFLRLISLTTGGEYFNLKKHSSDEIINQIGKSPYQFIKAEIDGKPLESSFPSMGAAVYGAFTFTGKLTKPEAKISLHFGTNGKIDKTQTFTVKQSDALEGSVLRTYYGQKMIDELLTFPKENKELIVKAGKEFGLVTPGTSLIVLDDVNQYVEHRIKPPASMPKWCETYNKRIVAIDSQLQQKKAGKMDRLISMWNEVCNWHKQNFKEVKRYTKKQNDDEFAEDNYGDDEFADTPIDPMAVRAVSASGNDDEFADDFGDDEFAEGVEVDEITVELAQSETMEDSFGGDFGDEEVEELEEISEPMGVYSERADSNTVANARSRQVHSFRSQVAWGEAAGKSTAKGSKSNNARISIKPWTPDAPYLSKMKNAKDAYKVYLSEKEEFGTSPAFFLDCSDFFLNSKNEKLGIRVLSNIAEMELENAALVRILAHRLVQLNKLELACGLFETVLEMREEEPQSYRDLALTLAKMKKYPQAAELLYQAVLKDWDRFDQIEKIMLVELNQIIAKAKRENVEMPNIDHRLKKLIDVDVRIVLNWDADNTDMDLWVTEPSGEKCFYSHNRTINGGRMSRDFTQGYGPEEYMVKVARSGKYKIQANYYGSRSQKISGAVTLQAEVYTNYGRENETSQDLTFRLTKGKEVVTVGEIMFKGDKTGIVETVDYQVKAGDSLFSIARKELGNGNLVPEIMKLNPQLKGTLIKVGQIIKLPK